MGDFDHSTTLQRLLDSIREGHPSDRGPLIEHALDRLRRITRHMFRRSPHLRGPDDTDDVLQKACLRLHTALTSAQPASVAAFFGLAVRQVRWVLLDILRQLPARDVVIFPGRDPPSTHKKVPEPHDPEGEPSSIAEWTEFHQAVERLPDEVRQVFEQVWYCGFTQQETADLLDLSLRTVQRRWTTARLQLQRMLHGDPPGV